MKILPLLVDELVDGALQSIMKNKQKFNSEICQELQTHLSVMVRVKKTLRKDYFYSFKLLLSITGKTPNNRKLTNISLVENDLPVTEIQG